MRRSLLLALLMLVAVPGAAPAAPVKLSPSASAVSPTGVTTIEAANPNRHALRGNAIVTVRGRKVATRSVRLRGRSVTTISLRLGSKALAEVRKAGGRVTISLRVRRPAGRLLTAKRTVTLQTAADTPQAPPATTPPATTPAEPAPAAAPSAPPPPPASNRWAGRMGSEGDYDDFAFTVVDGQMEITKPPTVSVLCLENGGSYASAVSFEIFDAPGPWTLGTDGSVVKQGVSVNQLVSGGARSITYKVTGTTQEPGRVAGTLGMSFSFSKLNLFTNTITFINCFGSQSFEAVPAP